MVLILILEAAVQWKMMQQAGLNHRIAHPHLVAECKCSHWLVQLGTEHLGMSSFHIPVQRL